MKNRIWNKLLSGIVMVVMSFLVTTSCQTPDTNQEPYQWERNWMWVFSDLKKSDEEWNAKLKRLKEGGVTGILIGGGVPMVERIIPLADAHGIDVHAWIWTLNRPGDKEAQKHPDWYTVSRKGESCFDVHPYVDYYQWVCPSKEEVYQHIEKQVETLAAVKGLKGIHLDYVRYSDVILAKGLQPKYGLVQDKEYPEFDFCYCNTCRDTFLTQSGVDVCELEDPTASESWRQYRYNSVTNLVNRLSDVAHGHEKLLSAAVFPYPEIARTICRQSWDDWNLDAAFPMVYPNFYDEDMDWVETSTRKGVQDLKGRIPLITGLYVPKILEEEFPIAVENAFKGGANGVSLFGYGKCTDAHFQAVVTNSEKYQKVKK